MSALSYLAEVALAVEKLRVASEVRLSHLAKRDELDPLTTETHEKLKGVEDWVDKQLKAQLASHPAFPWFSRVKGCGQGEVIGKLLGPIDIERADTISSLWKFAGFAPTNGKASRREKGRKLDYNSQLRMVCWRLAKNLILQQGKFYDFYLTEKEHIRRVKEAAGIKVMPTPPGRWCPACQKEVRLKTAKFCPDCQGPLLGKVEPPGVLYEGHLHAMAMRKMVKLFLACLWLTWRGGAGLPITQPYPQAILGHDGFIDPWEMVDREKASENEKPIAPKRARQIEKPISGERARHIEKPISGERAGPAEKPKGWERASTSEKPTGWKRAIVVKKPIGIERAIMVEKPRALKRAIYREKPNGAERAIDSEKPIGEERAIRREKPINPKREGPF